MARINVLRDMNNPNDTADHAAALFAVKRIDGDTDYVVAWGIYYAHLMSGITTMLPDEDDLEQTDVNGAKVFGTEEEASAYLDAIEEAQQTE